MKTYINFIKRYILRHPDFVFFYAFALLRKRFTFPISFYSASEITELMRSGKSLIRFGDGEISTIPLDLPNGYFNGGQEVNDTVRGFLASIARDYGGKDCPYVLAVPVFLDIENQILKKYSKLNIWLPGKVMFWKNFDKNQIYGDAHMFYYDDFFEKNITPAILDKKIIILTNARVITSLKSNPRFPFKDAVYIETPETNMQYELEIVKLNLNSTLKKLGAQNTVTLVAMGPFGKGLIYDYSRMGIQLIDIGIGLEVMYSPRSLEQIVAIGGGRPTKLHSGIH